MTPRPQSRRPGLSHDASVPTPAPGASVRIIQPRASLKKNHSRRTIIEASLKANHSKRPVSLKTPLKPQPCALFYVSAFADNRG